MKHAAARFLFGVIVAVLWTGVLVLGVVFWGRWEFESSLVNNRFIQARYGGGDWPLTADTQLDPAKLDIAEREKWIGPGKSLQPVPLTAEQQRDRWLARTSHFASLPEPLRYTFARMYRVDVYAADDRGRVINRYPDELAAPGGVPAGEILPEALTALLEADPGV
ncbi:MAG TPA: hypothetical protein PLX03_11090, partial [Candidatus Hydrogenedentes bacterium]|nr:hypothetical protein [Candidatus Hydrogenedentota bacterium]